MVRNPEVELMFKKILRNRRRRGKEFFGSNGCYLSSSEYLYRFGLNSENMAKKKKNLKVVQLELPFNGVVNLKVKELKTKNR